MTPAPLEDERQSVLGILGGLMRAIKSCSLYPEKHENRIKAVERVYEDLKNHLRNHPILRLEIGKDRLLFNEEPVYVAPEKQGNLPFVLFRDGIQTMEFYNGIDQEELASFLVILNQYWVLTEEPEGDLVTALWDAQIPHIRYTVSDVFWGPEPEVDLEDFSTGKAPGSDEAKPEFAGQQGAGGIYSDPFGQQKIGDAKGQESVPARDTGLPDWDRPIDPEKIHLTPEEEKHLSEWVIQEEQSDSGDDFLNAIFDSLLAVNKTEDLEIMLNALKTAFQEAFEQGNWDTASALLGKVSEIDHGHPDVSPGHPSWTKTFFSQISASPALDALREHLPIAPAEQLESIKRSLLLLTPEAIPTLSRILAQEQVFEPRKMLMEVIAELASRDLRPLESMLDTPDGVLVERLVNILGRLEGEKADALLGNLLNHPFSGVRREAAAALLRRDPKNIQRVASLMKDEDEVLRRLILGFLSRHRNPVAEDLIVGFLRSDSPLQGNSEHVLACFKALGFCGSSRSVPFLGEILKGLNWKDIFRSKSRSQGAVMALKAIGTPEARAVLERASRSLVPSLRRAASEALKDWKEK